MTPPRHTSLHLRAVDGREPRPRPVRGADARAARPGRHGRSTWPSSAPRGSACHDNDSFPRRIARPSGTGSSKRFRRRSTRPGCAWRWSPPTCSATPSSRTARSPRTIVACGARRRQGDARDRSRRRARGTSTCSGAVARASRPTLPRSPRDALDRYKRGDRRPCELRRRAGVRHALRARAEAERAPRRHLPADRRARAAFIEHARAPEMVGVNPEVAHETMAGLSFQQAVGPGAVGGQALPHRPQRPADRPVRPGLPLRLRGSEEAFCS